MDPLRQGVNFFYSSEMIHFVAWLGNYSFLRENLRIIDFIDRFLV